MEDVLKIKDLNVSFHVYGGEVKAVQHLSMNISKGEVYALVGESGCGKSTIAHTILKILPTHRSRVEASTIELCGKDIYHLSNEDMETIRGERVSMIFQDPMTSLNPTMKIGKQIVEILYRRKKLNAKECREESLRLLKLVQIPDAKIRYHQYPHQLSGGMKQRVLIAIALANHPDLLIADEPTTALDVTTQAQILEILSNIQKEGTSILFITHDFGVVARIADRVGVMYGGEIVEEGSVEEIFNNPLFPYTKSLMKCLPNGNKERRLYSIKGEPPDLYMVSQGCSFAKRCEECLHICLTKNPPICEVSHHHYVKCWKQDKDLKEQLNQQ